MPLYVYTLIHVFYVGMCLDMDVNMLLILFGCEGIYWTIYSGLLIMCQFWSHTHNVHFMLKPPSLDIEIKRGWGCWGWVGCWLVMLAYAPWLVLESLLLDCYTCAYIEPTCWLLDHYPPSIGTWCSYLLHTYFLSWGKSCMLGHFAKGTISRYC